MSLWDLVESPQTKNRINGVVVGIVTNNKDPKKLGRIKVKYPWLSEKEESNWARIASPMAGKERGVFVLPEVDDEVLIVFEHGDINRPYVVGSLWNGIDKPPETNSDGKNNIKLIKSRSGHTIKIDDTEGEEKIEIIDKSEGNKITIDSANNKVSIVSGGDIKISAPNGKITMHAKDIKITSMAATNIEALKSMNLKAAENMNVKGALINLNCP